MKSTANKTATAPSQVALKKSGLKVAVGAIIFCGLLVLMVMGTEIFDRENQQSEQDDYWSKLTPKQRTDTAFNNGDWQYAAAGYQRMVDEDPFNARALVRLGYSLQNLDRFDEAISAYEKTEDFEEFRPFVAYQFARIYALSKKPDQAIASLQKAIDQGYLSRYGIDNDEDLAGLRGDPEFLRLIEAEADSRQRQEEQNRRRRR